MLANSRPAAQVVRDVLHRAGDAHVTWLDNGDLPSGRVAGLHLVTPRSPGSSCGHGAPATAEVADAAPLALDAFPDERIRWRVRFHGFAAFSPATPSGPVRIRAIGIELERDGIREQVDVAAVADCTPDPFARDEGRLLSHVARSHPAELGAIRRLLPAQLHGARITPLALDAGGITLRARVGAARHDVRIGFPEPARDARELTARLQELVLRGRAPQMATLFRAGPLAARICDPGAA